MSQFYLSIKGVRQGQFKGTPNLRNSNDWMTGTRFSMQVDVPYDSSTGHPTGRRRYVPLIISKEWGADSNLAGSGCFRDTQSCDFGVHSYWCRGRRVSLATYHAN
jgi:hypothetical protein